MKASKAKKIAQGWESKWKKWRKQRWKANAFLFFFRDSYEDSKQEIKKAAKRGRTSTTVRIGEHQSYHVVGNIIGEKDALKLTGKELEDVMDSGAIALKNKLNEKGYKATFQKQWNDKDDYLNSRSFFETALPTYLFKIDWKLGGNK